MAPPTKQEREQFVEEAKTIITGYLLDQQADDKKLEEFAKKKIIPDDIASGPMLKQLKLRVVNDQIEKGMSAEDIRDWLATQWNEVWIKTCTTKYDIEKNDLKNYLLTMEEMHYLVPLDAVQKSIDEFIQSRNNPQEERTKNVEQINKAVKKEEKESKNAEEQTKNDPDIDEIFDEFTINEIIRADERGDQKKRGKNYYYAWWLFDNQKDYEEAKNKQTYPVNKGKLIVGAKEQQTKLVNSAFINDNDHDATKHHGHVKGHFLDYGKTPKRTMITTVLDSIGVQEGTLTSILTRNNPNDPVIALGAARVPRHLQKKWWQLKSMAKEVEEDEDFDPTQLRWNWQAWLGKGKQASVTIVVVDKRSLDETMALRGKDDNKYKEEYKKLFTDPEKGLDGANIKITPAQGSPTEKKKVPNGRIELAMVAGLNISVEASLAGYKRGKSIIPLSPFTVKNPQWVLVALEPTDALPEPEFIILPYHNPKDKHRKPLQREFGSKQKTMNAGEATKGKETGFLLKKNRCRKPLNEEELWIETIIIDMNSKEQITAAKWPELEHSSVKIKKQQEPINTSINLSNEWTTTGKEIRIDPLFTIPANAKPGTYRIYCLAKKTNTPYKDINEDVLQEMSVSEHFWDYNYMELIIRDGTTSEDRNTTTDTGGTPTDNTNNGGAIDNLTQQVEQLIPITIQDDQPTQTHSFESIKEEMQLLSKVIEHQNNLAKTIGEQAIMEESLLELLEKQALYAAGLSSAAEFYKENDIDEKKTPKDIQEFEKEQEEIEKKTKRTTLKQMIKKVFKKKSKNGSSPAVQDIIDKVEKKYGHVTIEEITQNPYRLWLKNVNKQIQQYLRNMRGTIAIQGARDAHTSQAEAQFNQAIMRIPKLNEFEKNKAKYRLYHESVRPALLRWYVVGGPKTDHDLLEYSNQIMSQQRVTTLTKDEMTQRRASRRPNTRKRFTTNRRGKL